MPTKTLKDFCPGSLLKPLQNKKDKKKFEGTSHFFGPSYFETALEGRAEILQNFGRKDDLINSF